MPVYVKQGRADRGAVGPDPVVRDTVARVIDDIRSRGDEAVREYSSKFDGWSPDSFRLGTDAIADIVATVPGEVLDDILTVQENVRVFARHQRLADEGTGGLAGAAQPPGRRVGCLRARWPLPAGRLRPHDRGDGKGGGRQAGCRVHPADPRPGARRDSRRHAPGRCRRDLPARRGAGCGGDGDRD